MKNAILTFFAALLMVGTALAQVPQAMKYQAVVRDASGQIQANQTVTLGIDLVQNGNAVYLEDHTVTTNAFGLANLNIGQGTLVGGSLNFDQIDWSVPTSITVYLDGNNLGTSELLSVPYALHAANGGGGVNTDNQTLSISGNDLSISGGNTVTLPGGGGGTLWDDLGNGMIGHGNSNVVVGPTESGNSNAGSINVNGPGVKNIYLGGSTSEDDSGIINVYDGAGNRNASMFAGSTNASVNVRVGGIVKAGIFGVNSTGAGELQIRNTSSNIIGNIGATGSNSDRGRLYLGDDAGLPKVNFFVEDKGNGGFDLGGLGTD